MDQLLAVRDVVEAIESEPTIIEIRFALEDSSSATLRINAFHLQKLAALIQPHLGG